MNGFKRSVVLYRECFYTHVLPSSSDLKSNDRMLSSGRAGRLQRWLAGAIVFRTRRHVIELLAELSRPLRAIQGRSSRP